MQIVYHSFLLLALAHAVVGLLILRFAMVPAVYESCLAQGENADGRNIRLTLLVWTCFALLCGGMAAPVWPLASVVIIWVAVGLYASTGLLGLFERKLRPTFCGRCLAALLIRVVPAGVLTLLYLRLSALPVG